MTLARVGRLAGRVAFAVGSIVLLLEIALRLAPGLVGPKLANAVYAAYGPGGIYFRDRDLGMNFQWPNYERRAFWNGRWWHHRTDELGFRNPPDLADRSLMLLGDSLIYGHGVEEEDTMADMLRKQYGRPAYDMARQGDCLFQEYVLARLYMPLLRPETVVLFVFLNDFNDLEVYRTPAEIADPPELDRVDYAASLDRVQHQPRFRKLGEQPAQLLVWRLAKGIIGLIRKPPDPAADARAMLASIFEPPHAVPIERYYQRVLADLARRCRDAGAELLVVLLELPDAVLPNATAAQEQLFSVLGPIGAQAGFRVLGTRDVFRDCEDCFLSNDGHFTREGHRRLAAFLDAQLPPRPLQTTP